MNDEYNNSGAIARHNDRLFGYDAWGNLAGVAENDNVWYYGYDVNGIRSAKIDGDTSIQYFTDANANVISESDTDGNQTAEMIYANQALARKVNGNWYYYLYNAHGDVIGLTDSQGNIVNSYEYDAWGNILNQTETIDNPLKYAGQYYDEELQMYYLRARYYDPSIGRFTSIDAIEGNISQPLDMNQYVYCRNNPIYYIDSNGESVVATCIIIGAIVGAVAGGFAGAYVSKKTTGTVNGTSVAIGVLGGATVGGLLGWGAYALGASVSVTGLASSATGIYKTLDKGVNFATRALQHMDEKGRTVPVQVLIDAIIYGTPKADPQGTNAIMYYIDIFRNGKPYVLEVLYDKATNTIFHFKYQ